MSRLALSPTQLPAKWVPWTLSLVVKKLYCEADHSPKSTTKIKYAWSYTYTPP